MALEAHLKRAQSAMHEVAIVRAHAVSPVTRRILQPPEDVGIRRGHCAEHDVGMSRKIFGRCSDRHIDAMFNRPEIERRSEEHTSELQSLMRISYAVFCLKKKNKK